MRVFIDDVEQFPSHEFVLQGPEEFVVPDWVILKLRDQNILEREDESLS